MPHGRTHARTRTHAHARMHARTHARTHKDYPRSISGFGRYWHSRRVLSRRCSHCTALAEEAFSYDQLADNSGERVPVVFDDAWEDSDEEQEPDDKQKRPSKRAD
jgi:hypothetical protein